VKLPGTFLPLTVVGQVSVNVAWFEVLLDIDGEMI